MAKRDHVEMITGTAELIKAHLGLVRSSVHISKKESDCYEG